MEGLGKEVDRRYARGRKGAELGKAREVARQRGGVAAYVGDGPGGLRRQLRDDVLRKARPRRVHDDDVGLAVGELASGVSAYGLGVCNVG